MNNENNNFENNGNQENIFGQNPDFKADTKDDSAENMSVSDESVKTEDSHPDDASTATGDTEGGFATPASEKTGEYHYRGNQMGDFGKEQFTPYNNESAYRQSQHQNGSYTYNGFRGQEPPRDQFGNQPFGDNGYGRPPYGEPGRWAGYQPQRNNFGGAPVHAQKEKKPRKGISGGVLAIVCALTVIISALAGVGAAYMFSRNRLAVQSNSGESSGGGTTVIDRVVENDDEVTAAEKGNYAEVAAKVKDTVVEITTEFQVTGFFQYISEGAGSGVIISEDGYIITNNHVISDTGNGGVADSITVRLTNGEEYEAKLVGKDADSDVAVIKITAEEKLEHAVFGDSDKLIVGEEVMAVGNPLGELGGTVTNGIISALDREMEVDGTTMNLLQTNAAVNPGNSGGGLFNMKGELVGVVNAKSSGSGIEGLGFAIPSNDAYDVARQLMEHGYVTGKVYIGIGFTEVDDPYTAYKYFRSQATGVYVTSVEEGYNDDALQKGDRVVAIDGDEITSFSQIKDAVNEHSIGDKLEFSIYRKGKLMHVEVECYEYVPEQSDSVDFDE